MKGFLKRIIKYLSERPSYTGDQECFYIDQKCPKCGSERIKGTLKEKKLEYEDSVEYDDEIEYIENYWIKCKFKCLDCGYEWENYGSYEDRYTEKKNNDDNFDDENEDENEINED